MVQTSTQVEWRRGFGGARVFGAVLIVSWVGLRWAMSVVTYGGWWPGNQSFLVFLAFDCTCWIIGPAILIIGALAVLFGGRGDE
ncbi:MAG: hypothetical protein JNG88_04525 [Phycisphaerales bacterium]|nr:hypothetical protein [Phycisphaerales bacterium]